MYDCMRVCILDALQQLSRGHGRVHKGVGAAFLAVSVPVHPDLLEFGAILYHLWEKLRVHIDQGADLLLLDLLSERRTLGCVCIFLGQANLRL